MKMDDGVCPVCGGPTDRTMDSEEGRVYEQDEVCRQGCYSYEFAYGYHKERIGEQEWEWTYRDESPYRETREAIERLRKGKV